MWVWPDQMSDRLLLKILWHESGHVAATHEWAAGAYAYCRMTPEQRLRHRVPAAYRNVLVLAML